MKRLSEYPIHVARAEHRCVICNMPIRPGMDFRDGGHGHRRAHLICAELAREAERGKP